MKQNEKIFMPYGRQSLDDDDIKAVIDVLKSDMWTTGPLISKLEKQTANLFNVNCSVSVSSGTAGLHLVSLAAGFSDTTMVIVPSVTFVATANGARYCGSDVFISDVDAETGLITPELVKVALDNVHADVSAVFVVHLAGRAADVCGIAEVLKAHPRAQSCIIVEDACHAFGTFDTYGEPIGSCAYSDYCVFSLHPVKTVAAGEGGIVTTKSEENAKRLKLFRSHGITREPDEFINPFHAREGGTDNEWYYEAQMLGFNYRLTDIQAGLAVSQISRLHSFISKRQKLLDRYHTNWTNYETELRKISEIKAPKSSNLTSWHLCVFLIDFSRLRITKNELMKNLRKFNIGTQVHYIPLQLHPTFADASYHSLDGAMEYYSKCISLPLYYDLQFSDVDYICDRLRDILAENMI